jgi:hypothetical protein
LVGLKVTECLTKRESRDPRTWASLGVRVKLATNLHSVLR